ncbi:MAG TPA: formate dehydrogenase accessory sulfurtransferase FdhD [Bacteroidia bacterium]|nr:formate dehydrogenase accessory sulfurtransferase FdhD [Bacteroidia bacterium]HNU32619.1 formate dehydrogenase accessory sulfurtransferase FdhD [Bacteroidia bacterium]
MSQSVLKTPVLKYSNQGAKLFEDLVAVEEPLEIKLSYSQNGKQHTKNISVTMRTPGNDTELAIGFLFTEGIIKQSHQVKNVKSGALQNSITIEMMDGFDVALEKLNRHFYTTSSCGVCGKESIEAIKTIKEKTETNTLLKVSADVLYSLPEKLNNAQSAFLQTGGIHGSALFNLHGDLIALREDVGRHNALDKLIGSMLMENKIPLTENILLLSGRASFELIQKSVMAGINLVVAIGAPSSLAVELAKEFNVTLVGFLKHERFNIYSHEERVEL